CFTFDFSLCFNFSLSEPSLSAFSPLFPEAVVESDFFLSLFRTSATSGSCSSSALSSLSFSDVWLRWLQPTRPIRTMNRRIVLYDLNMLFPLKHLQFRIITYIT